MNKAKYIALVITAAVLLTACGNGTSTTTTTTTGAAETTTTTAENTAAETTTTSADETAPAEETPAAETTPTEAAPAEGAEIISCTDFHGNPIDVAMTANEYGSYEGTTDFTYFRKSSGQYYTSDANPELFDISSYSCTAECATGEEFTAKAGDTFGSLTINNAYSSYYGYTDENGVKGGNWMSHGATFDGTVTLDGYLVYFTEDEYGVSIGDIVFLPKPESLIANDFPIAQSAYIGAYTFMSENANFAFCGDTQPLMLGNVMNNYADNAEINGIFDGSWNVKPATVTLSGIELISSEQFGNGHSSAVIEAITLG